VKRRNGVSGKNSGKQQIKNSKMEGRGLIGWISLICLSLKINVFPVALWFPCEIQLSSAHSPISRGKSVVKFLAVLACK